MDEVKKDKVRTVTPATLLVKSPDRPNNAEGVGAGHRGRSALNHRLTLTSIMQVVRYPGPEEMVAHSTEETKSRVQPNHCLRQNPIVVTYK